MRLAFLGANGLTVSTVQALAKAGHEIIIIERDAERIGELSETLDCAFLHGDGSKPDVLHEIDPEHTDILYCVTGSDQTNIITSLVGKNLGIARVVTIIEDEDYLPICEQLGLDDTIIPVLTVSRHLVGLTKVAPK